jgi:hypothetical protein
MSSWILQINPNDYRTDNGAPVYFYREGEEDWWGIRRYFDMVNDKDIVYIWQSNDHRIQKDFNSRGIYAKAVVTIEPNREHLFEEKIKALKQRYKNEWNDPAGQEIQKRKRTVVFIYCKPTKELVLSPLIDTELINAGLANIGPFGFTQGDIYKISQDQADKIEELIRDKLNIK